MGTAPTAQAGHQATATLPVPEVVRKLEQARTALADVDVDLADHIPSIVVIGDQSTGKSSLLSALTQLQLPTGDNIVTRAPLKIFIRPGTEHQATLQYRLHKADGSLERRSVHLSAADLQANPERVAEAIRTAQKEMYNSLKATAPGHWTKYVLGDLDNDNNDDSWLLKDEIELFVDMPDEKGSFTVVDLPGLYRPVGQKQFTQDLEEWVTEKIKRDNVIILSAMTAAIAVDGGSGNLSVANTLAYDVDKEHRRTLDIITKADTVVDKIPYVLKAAVARSKPGTCTGCVLVAINPSGFRTEEECLQQFGGAEVAKLMDAGGGLGVRHLFGKLVQLQEAMVLNLNWSSLIKKLQKKLDALDSELAECKDLPITEADAVRDVERRLGLAAQSFCNACINAPATDESGDITSTMIEGVYAAGQRYIKKQSDFIPGILGKKEVLEIIMKATEIDTMANLPDELSEYTAVKLFLVFHKRVASYAVEYVGEAHEAVEEAIIGLLRLHLREEVHPNLASAAVDAAKEVLKKYKKLLCAAVEDVTHAFSYVVEPLHTQVLYLTYRRQLLLASGILVDPQDFEKVEQAAKVEAAKHIKQRSESDASGTGLDQFKRERAAQEGTGSSAGPSNTGAIVGSVVGDISAIALSLTPAGPFAGPLGLGIAYLISQAWDAFRDALHKYKTAYNCKKEKYKSKMEQLEGVCADYKAADFQINLVPLLWPADKDPMTSFELMCNMMNCDPGYVVEALEFYYTAFGQQLKEKKLARSFSAVDLQKALIGCLCRMLCSHYAMTESVAKLVRMRLMSTHTYVLSPDAAMPDLSLPTQLRELLRDELEAQHEGGLLPLLAGKENIARVKKLQKQKQGMEEAIKLVKACLPVK